MVGKMNTSIKKVVEISSPTSTGKAKPGRGAASLRQAVDEVLRRDSKNLAEALSKSGQNGAVQSTKFMYELSEERATDDNQEEGRVMRSMVLELAGAPQWTGPLPSEMDDMTDDDVVE